MKPKFILVLSLFLMSIVVFFYYSCTKDKGPLIVKTPCDGLVTKYASVISPTIMQTKCAYSGCHDAAGNAPGNFTTYPDLKIVADNGKLKDRVLTKKDMPPLTSPPFPDSLRKKLDCWIQKGAQNN